jgi:hypothetical protein
LQDLQAGAQHLLHRCSHTHTHGHVQVPRVFKARGEPRPRARWPG